MLLDTNALIWALRDPHQLTGPALRTLENPKSQILVSAATAWEISTKVRLGKLPESVSFESRFVEVMDAAGFTMVSITAEIALRSARLIGEHRDPFDRIIAAHALAEDIPIISADPKLDAFGVRRLW